MGNKVLEALGDRVGRRCVYDRDGETWGIYFFDWAALSVAFRDSFVGDIFGDCDPEHFPGLLSFDDGPAWKPDSRWLPIGLDNVQDEEVELAAGDGFAEYPQFDRLLLVNLDELGGDTIAVHAIDVDGTALPAQAPDRFWDALAPDRFRRP